MIKFFFKFKKLYSWPTSPTFEAKKVFFQKLKLCHTQLQGFQHQANIQRNLMIQFQENSQKDNRMEAWIDPILWDSSSYQLPVVPLTSTTTVDWHLKVQDIEYDVGLTKSYCTKVSMQKISLIHTLTLRIQEIFRSCKLNKWPHLF